MELGSENQNYSPSKVVDIKSIERELKNLWKQLTEEQEGEIKQPVTRVTVLNLIIYAPGETTYGRLNETVAELTKHHPGRVVLIVIEPDAAPTTLDAQVTAICHPTSGGRKQVCCEEVLVSAGAETVKGLPSLVDALLTPDLPTALWWRDLPRLDAPLFNRLASSSDHVILDSLYFEDPVKGLFQLDRFIKSNRHTSFSDLNWGRLTPWRSLIAAFFDVRDFNPYLFKLNDIAIEYGLGPRSDQAAPARAWLLAAWLASNLGWEFVAAARAEDHSERLLFQKGDRKIAVELRGQITDETRKGTLISVKLSADADPPAKFIVSKTEDRHRFETREEIAGVTSIGKVDRVDEFTEVYLVGAELELLGRDFHYEQALDTVAKIAAAR